MRSRTSALVAAAARRVGVVPTSAVVTRQPVVATAVRCVGTSVFEAPDADFVRFPREQSGLNYGLNWSLADDDVTPRGRAFRNLATEELASFVTDSTAKTDAPLYATDEFAGFEVADIDAFEEQLEKLKDSFMSQPNLFVEDGAVGSARNAEIRVRVISDDASYALFFRNMLQRVPLKDPQTIPRPLIVYVATNMSAESNYTVSDFDPDTGRGVVAVCGNPGFDSVRQQVQHVAAQMYADGGYAGQRGGGVRVQLAREDGSLDFDDSHYIAESASGNILLPGAAHVADDGTTAIHIDAEVNASAYAAHACVWSPDGVSAFWSGSLTSDGAASLAASAVKAQAHPAKIVVPGGAGDAADLASKLGMSEEAAAVFQARVEEQGVKVVKATAANAVGGGGAAAAASGGKKAQQGKTAKKKKGKKAAKKE